MMTIIFYFVILKVYNFYTKIVVSLMKKIFLFFTILSSFSIFFPKTTIKAVFFDIETVFSTNKLRASGYIGKIDSIRYIASVGHTPSQEDLFKQLESIKAESTEVTYNNNLKMPLIFSDWLTAKKSGPKIKDIVQKYFMNKNISDIEKKVLLAIVSMMMTPQHLADIQQPDTGIFKLIEKLKQQGIKVFLTGNWAHINSLKAEFPDNFKLFNGVFVSGDLKILKPSSEFYETVLNQSQFTSEQAVWIETEPKFISKARSYGMNVITHNRNNHSGLIQGLKQLGISI